MYAKVNKIDVKPEFLLIYFYNQTALRDTSLKFYKKKVIMFQIKSLISRNYFRWCKGFLLLALYPINNIKMKRVAVPVVKGQLSEHFGQCNHYEIFEIDNGNVKSEELEIPPKEDITKLPEWAAGEGITDIIAYKIDKRIITLFTPFRINLFVGIPINSPRNLIDDYINGRLKSDETIISEIMD